MLAFCALAQIPLAAFPVAFTQAQAPIQPVGDRINRSAQFAADVVPYIGGVVEIRTYLKIRGRA
jgi:hypothetical protein